MAPSDLPATWHAMSSEACQTQLSSLDKQGLAEADAANRLQQYGPNSLRQTQAPAFWQLLLSQFKSPLVLLLLAAGVTAFLLGESLDAGVILFIVLLNAVIGSVQEFNAERSIEALKAMTSPRARVRRGGAIRMIPAADLVPGDWIELESGDLVPADARLLETASLRCVEAALTGEPEGVSKDAKVTLETSISLPDRKNMIFQGTVVADGWAAALVVATGMQTELGRIAKLLDGAEDSGGTPLQKRIAAFGKTMTWACLALVIFMAALGYWRDMPPMAIFLTAVSLAVAAVPEGLPAVVTIAMSLGVRRMARRNALIRRLPAVETLGSASVICTDKTGTLTQGIMATQIYSFGQERIELPPSAEGNRPRALRLAEMHALCNNAALNSQGDTGDPTEVALLRSAVELGVKRESLGWQKKQAFPFDSVRKRQSAWFQNNEGFSRLIVHGAPESLIALCTQADGAEGLRALDEASRQELLTENTALAGLGLRVLATAYREMPKGSAPGRTSQESESELVFAGFAGLRDPLRPEAGEAVAACHGAGLQVVLITGDQAPTARNIASQLGLLGEGKELLTGTELDAIEDAVLVNRIRNVTVYARVTPEHKLRIVRAWRATGAVTAMTGDGVNDAPALKGADIGIAMGQSGTEVAKQASDMVLADDRFATVVAAIEEGRTVYANIRNTLQYLLAGNTGELLLMVTALAMGMPIPLLPVHLLWINLLTDGFPALALAAEKGEKNLMRFPPRRQNESLTGRGFLLQMGLTGLLTGGCALLVFAWALPRRGLDEARSLAFAVLVIEEALRALGARSAITPLWRLAWRGRWLLPATVLGLIVLQIAVHDLPWFHVLLKTTPLPWSEWAMVFALGCVPLAVLEALKVLNGFRRGKIG